eukprot:COSAG02_NODE_552_length_20429_cov_28.014068_12_plen_630_part_00
MVDAFAAHRPVCADTAMVGLRIWQPLRGDECSLYVKNNIEYHIRAGLDSETEQLPTCVEQWLMHHPSEHNGARDDLIASAIRVVGTPRLLTMLKTAAADANNDWLTCCLCEAWRVDKIREVGRAEVWSGKHNDTFALAMPALRRLALDGQRPAMLEVVAFEHWAVHMCVAHRHVRGILFHMSDDEFLQVFTFYTADDVKRFAERALHLLETTEAGRAHPLDAAKLRETEERQRLIREGDFDKFHLMEMTRSFKELEDRAAGGESRLLAALDINGAASVGFMMEWLRLPEWDWKVLDGLNLARAWCSYDHELDAYTDEGVAPSLPTPFLWGLRGDISTTNTCFDFSLAQCQHWMSELSGPHEVIVRERLEYRVARHMGYVLWILGRQEDAAKLMTEIGITWATADVRVDALAVTSHRVRERGTKVDDGGNTMTTAEEVAWTCKLSYVLCTSWREVPPADVVAALPSPDVLDSYVTGVTKNSRRSQPKSLFVHNLLLMAAEVCEKLERPDDALLYVAKAMRVDDNDPDTDVRPTTHARGHALRGRMLATHGKQEEAEAAFERSIEISHRTGLRLFEMFTLRDLKKHVLDNDGRGEEGIRRLKGVLKEMKGPPAELTKLLGGGLDAEAILRS